MNMPKNVDLNLSAFKSFDDIRPIHVEYLRSLIKHIRKTDDDFRWLSCVPCKNEQGKIKQYRWVNIKARESDGSDSKLLEEVNAFWHKHAVAAIKGLERKQKRMRMLAEMTEEQHKRDMYLMEAYWKYESQVGIYCGNKNTVDDIIASLRSEGRLEKLSAKHYTQL